MSLEESIKELSKLIPFHLSSELLEQIALNSSAIVFSKPGEVLFKNGDKALGFYWLLKGSAVMLSPDGRILCDYQQGQMAGLDSFLNRELHPFDIVTHAQEVHTLFVDKRCYDQIMESGIFAEYMNQQLLSQLKSLKSAI